jgi:hypothetical protein
MMQQSIVNALLSLGFDSGWVATEYGITLWENEEPQPTETELIAAGWNKPVAEQAEAEPELPVEPLAE